MRYLGAVLCVLALGMTSSSAWAARVLVPEDTPATSSSTTAPAAPAVTAPTPKAQQVQAPAPTASTATSSVDRINPVILDDASISEMKSRLPPELQALSNDELRRSFSEDMMSIDGVNLQQFIKTDPKTGTPVVDYAKLNEAMKQKNTQPQSVQIKPGGAIGKKAITEQEAITAKLLGQGYAPVPQSDLLGYRDMIMKIRKDQEKARERPPIFFEHRESPTSKNMLINKSLLVGIMEAYTWGEEDVKDIQNDFGYTREEIPQNCQLRLRLQATTDDGMGLYVNYGFSGTQMTIYHRGALKSLDGRAMAVCNKPKVMPQKGSMIDVYGDKYLISIGKGSCTVPQPGPDGKVFVPVSAGIKYEGDGKFACAFK